MSENGVDRRTVVAGLGTAAVSGVCSTLGVGRARSAEAGGQIASPPEDYEAVLAAMDGDGFRSNPYVVTDVGELQAMAGARDAHFVLGDNVDASPTDTWNETTEIRREFLGWEEWEEVQTARAPIVEGSVTIYTGGVGEYATTTVDPAHYDLDLETGAITFDADADILETHTYVSYEIPSPVHRGFDPIGDDDGPFRGSFDGRGYTVSQLSVDRPGEALVGLFGTLAPNDTEAEATVGNVRLDAVSLTGRDATGGLVGRLDGGSVRDATVTGTLRGRRDDFFGKSTGGVVGLQRDGRVRSCRSPATIRGHLYCGGIVGWVQGGTLRGSRASGAVTHGIDAGGLVGRVAGTVTESFATGTIAGDHHVGGFVGSVDDSGTVEECYATGDVAGEAVVGGFAGGAAEAGTIRACHARGDVEAATTAGTFVGTIGDDATVSRSHAAGTGTTRRGPVTLVGSMSAVGQAEDSVAVLRECYWDATRTGLTEPVGSISADGGDVQVETVRGLTTAEMQGASTARTMDALDFSNTWAVPSAGSYPPLRLSFDTGPGPTPTPSSTSTPSPTPSPTPPPTSTTAPPATAARGPESGEPRDGSTTTTGGDGAGLTVTGALTATAGLVYLLRRRVGEDR